MWRTNLKTWNLKFWLLFVVISGGLPYLNAQQNIDSKVDSVFRLMTLDEKIGQLNQYSSYWATGPVSKETDKLKEIKEGKVGSLLNVRGTDKTRALQEIAMQSRMKIPLLFGMDVIHGYRTTFPIPLAEASSWDLDAIKTSARVAATEAAAAGIHWTFAPMVDISRDPRWGRVMEGAGEDTYLGCQIAKARVTGFQGTATGKIDEVMACVKHFAGYGAAIGGRDYNSVDMSERMLWETYLPPFKAAVDAGAATVMNAFNDFNGIPSTANSYLLRDILKGKWNFGGFVVSDWASVAEMIPHGYVENKQQAAQAAIVAGCDMDMEGRAYTTSLKQLVLDKKVSEELIDDAVKRILRKKFEWGLFDDPFRFCNPEREKNVINNTNNRILARDIARKSIVLLKNQTGVLPLSIHQKVAIIGPLAKSKQDMLGGWSVNWSNNDDVVTPYEGISAIVEGKNIFYAQGCNVNDSVQAGFTEAIRFAQKADVIICFVGENASMSGEARSRSNIQLPGVQENLLKKLSLLGKPIVVVVSAGRPLVFNWVSKNIPAILYSWWLGSEAGNAITDVLYGNYNPSAKLPMTFPKCEGQIPIYYNYNNTGRPDTGDPKQRGYHTGYIDLSTEPQYPFGFGLSYTNFEYSDLSLTKSEFGEKDSVIVSFSIQNVGNVRGEEIAQVYIRDKVASLIRPVKELKWFTKIQLNPGEKQTLSFTVDANMLSFYNNQLQKVTEPGEFDIMIGTSSADIKLKTNLIFR